jgi:hypothetical protein
MIILLRDANSADSIATPSFFVTVFARMNTAKKNIIPIAGS